MKSKRCVEKKIFYISYVGFRSVSMLLFSILLLKFFKKQSTVSLSSLSTLQKWITFFPNVLFFGIERDIILKQKQSKAIEVVSSAAGGVFL